MAETDQARPLAPTRDHPSSDDEEAIQRIRHRRIKLCGCVTSAFLLLLVIVIVILIFTVFKVKDPKVRTNGITLTNLELTVNPIPQVKVNMSLLVDMSIKNPNAASFKFSNTTTTIYYHGVAVAEAQGPPGLAEAQGPPGLAKARRTLRMNVTVEIMADRLGPIPDLAADVSRGQLNMSSYSVISGRVKVLNIVKKHVEVRMNCTVTVSISSRAIHLMNCLRKVKL